MSAHSASQWNNPLAVKPEHCLQYLKAKLNKCILERVDAISKCFHRYSDNKTWIQRQNCIKTNELINE